MVSATKAATYAAWTLVAVIAAAARPASADVIDRLVNPGALGGEVPSRDEVFNESYSFSDEDAPTFESGADIAQPDRWAAQEPVTPEPDLFDEAWMLVGTWAWEGMIEGYPTYMETTFYDDGTYESFATTALIDLYETGVWSLENGVLQADITDYYPHVIQTPYGPEPLDIDRRYVTALQFIDDDTVQTDIGLSYRVY